MALFLTEKDVIDLLPMHAALERVEASFLEQHRGKAHNQARQRLFLPHVSLHYMAGALEGEGVLGMKIYTVSHQGLRFLVLLYNTKDGALLALIEADHLGRVRTGAASGVATKYMARPDAATVAVIGTGRQARTQLEAVTTVRKVQFASVYGRDEARRRAFAEEMTGRLGLKVSAANSAREAVEAGDIVITATTSVQPVLLGEWLRPGAHINAIGANMLNRREVDDAALGRCAVISVEFIEQAKKEAGDLVHGLATLGIGWDRVHELHEIVGGSYKARNSADDITLFKSSGITLWDIAVGAHVYRKALEASRGKELEIFRDAVD
jgi:ornithine cyclodeaminase/alanine dehydrogenase-like protein (mu-crystallin family)